jgi:hypothetical protein
MRKIVRTLLITSALSLSAVGAARAEDEYVTGKDKIMCTTQTSLREAVKAITEKNRDLMRTVQGCNYSIDGVRAEILQDNVSMVKIRLGHPDETNRAEFWTLPDSIRPANKR